MGRRWRKPEYVRGVTPGAVKRDTLPQGTLRTRRREVFERARAAERRRRRVRISAAVGGAFLGIVLLAALVTYLQVSAGLRSGFAADPRIREALDPRGDLAHEPFYVLILGTDRREGESVGRPDTIILTRVDAVAGRVSMLSIPRDARVELPGHGSGKLNSATSLGGAALMIEAVRELTGVPVNHYMEIDFGGFKEIVDALGGVWIDVPMRIDDRRAASEYPEARVIEAGRQKLDGKHALTFVRARYDLPRQDLDRIANQQIFLKAVMAQALAERNPLRIRALAQAASRSIDTDLDIGQLMAVARSMADAAGNVDMAVAPGSPGRVGGVSYVIVEREALSEMMTRMQAGEAMVQHADEPLVVPTDVSVTVHNGAGIQGVAAAAAARLEAVGFEVREVGNANRFVYDETLVVYRSGGEDVASHIVSVLDLGRAVPSRSRYGFDTDILVVVGKDWGTR